MNDSKLYGVWIGKDATIAITEKLQIAFLRIKPDKIISILKQFEKGVIGAVYGTGVKSNATASICMINSEGILQYSSEESKDYIDNHKNDRIEFRAEEDNAHIVYSMYDGSVFQCELAEVITITDSSIMPEKNPDIPLEKRLEIWRLGSNFSQGTDEIQAGIDTHRYSVNYYINSKRNGTYCRVGNNGYCEKGYAMLSTTVIRPNETRMIKNNMDSIAEYKPILDCFVKNGCAFPPDGGWYWSLKEMNDDLIKLNGCQNAEYHFPRIHKKYEGIA